MPKEEWGTKRLCPQCNTRFYDLTKNPMICPACAHEFTLESLNEGRGRAMVSSRVSNNDANKELADDEDEDLDTDSNDLDDDLLEDDDDDSVSLDEIADVSSDDDD